MFYLTGDQTHLLTLSRRAISKNSTPKNGILRELAGRRRLSRFTIGRENILFRNPINLHRTKQYEIESVVAPDDRRASESGSAV
jgi:hypothetical protein